MVEMDREKAVLREYFGYQRASVLAILDGLSEASLRTPVLASGWTLLGLVEHLGHADRHWFQDVLTGSAVPLPWPDDAAAPLTTGRAPSRVFRFYRDQCQISDANVEGTSLTAAPIGRHPDELLAR